jgi:hypothetical protein
MQFLHARSPARFYLPQYRRLLRLHAMHGLQLHHASEQGQQL